MKLRVVWAGLAAFVLALVIVLPVRWVTGLLPPQLHCATWSGSVWHGQCAKLTFKMAGQPPLQADLLLWKIRPTALLRRSLHADFDVRTSQGTASGQVELGRDERLALRNVSARVQFDRRLASMLGEGWNGQLEGRNLVLQMKGMKLQALSGELDLRDFNDGQGGEFGSYTLLFPSSAAPPFVGRLRDAGGPLEVSASLTIAANRQWTLKGKIAARPTAAYRLRNSLDVLGAPDDSGRYPLSIEGSFK
jgi:Type II secretion system (T2SS), protein N